MRLRDFLKWGDQALALQHFELAEEIARYVLRQSPSNLVSRTLLGHIYLESRRFKEAEEHIVQALDIDPEDVATLIRFGEILQELGRHEERLLILQRAFECDPTRMDIKQRLAALQAGSGNGSTGNGFLTRAGLARIHLRCGLLEHAIAEFALLLEGADVHWSSQVALMEAHWLNGERQAASRIADEILREHPNCLKAILLSADVRAQIGLVDQARQLLERARQIDPDFALARALYPANGPSRLPLPTDDADVEVPIDFLQRIEATLATRKESDAADARKRAAARVSARAAAEGQKGEQRIIVTPALSETSPAEEMPASPPQSASDTNLADNEEVQPEKSWEALLQRLEREGGQMDEDALDALSDQLGDLAANAPNKLKAWQELGDVFHRIEQTDRAMRAYMRALESSTAQQEES